MYGDPKAKIEEIIRNGYVFKFGDYLSKGFSLLQKNLGGFIVFTLVFIILSAVINFIPFIGWLANSLFISPALTVGFYLVARKLDLGKNTEFGDFFKGFDFVGQLAITALVMTGIILATLIPFYFAGGGSEFMNWYLEILKNPATAAENPVPDIPSWSVLLVLPAIYLGIAYSWSYMFVAFYNMSFWDAMESSRKLITQKWLIYFAFMIVLGLVAAAGFILLCVGILAAIPAIYCMQYAAFADVTKLNSETGNTDNIEQHLVE